MLHGNKIGYEYTNMDAGGKGRSADGVRLIADS